MQIWNSLDQRGAPAVGLSGLSGAASLKPAGLLDATCVATNHGWVDAKTVVPGDQLLTFRSGLQPVVSVTVGDMVSATRQDDPSHWALFVPKGTLGNASDITVMPGQSVLIESALAADLMGHRFVLIRAADLDLMNGVLRVAPSAGTKVVMFQLAKADMIYAAGGALCSCRGALPSDVDYPVLTASEASMIINHEILPTAASAARRSKTPPLGC